MSAFSKLLCLFAFTLANRAQEQCNQLEFDSIQKSTKESLTQSEHYIVTTATQKNTKNQQILSSGNIEIESDIDFNQTTSVEDIFEDEEDDEDDQYDSSYYSKDKPSIMRDLRGRSSSSSSSSSRSSASRYSASRSSTTRTSSSSNRSYRASNGVYTYQSYASPVNYYNQYYSNGKTYSQLYVYYRPANYYNAAGYYSTVYLMNYYDGYGYNFFYGTYGYYEYSVHPCQDCPDTNIVFEMCIVLFVMFCVIPICYVLYMTKYHPQSLERVYAESDNEEIVVEHHDDKSQNEGYPPPPPQYQMGTPMMNQVQPSGAPYRMNQPGWVQAPVHQMGAPQMTGAQPINGRCVEPSSGALSDELYQTERLAMPIPGQQCQIDGCPNPAYLKCDCSLKVVCGKQLWQGCGKPICIGHCEFILKSHQPDNEPTFYVEYVHHCKSMQQSDCERAFEPAQIKATSENTKRIGRCAKCFMICFLTPFALIFPTIIILNLM